MAHAKKKQVPFHLVVVVVVVVVVVAVVRNGEGNNKQDEEAKKGEEKEEEKETTAYWWPALVGRSAADGKSIDSIHRFDGRLFIPPPTTTSFK